MKLATPLTLLCASSGALSYVIQRQLQVVESVLAQVQSGVDNVDAAVNSFAGDVTPVTTASKNLVSTINSGNAKVKGSSDLSFGDALGLINPVQDLKKHAEALTSDLKARRADIEKTRQCDVTRAQISNINTASQALIKTVVSKVPSSAQGIAADQANGITDTLTDAQDAFSDANCKNAA